jgi:hypothetical protein
MLTLSNKLVGFLMGFIALFLNFQVWQGHLKRSDDKFREGFFMLLNNQESVCFQRSSHYRSYYSLSDGHVVVIDSQKRKTYYSHIFSYWQHFSHHIDYQPAFD